MLISHCALQCRECTLQFGQCQQIAAGVQLATYPSVNIDGGAVFSLIINTATAATYKTCILRTTEIQRLTCCHTFLFSLLLILTTLIISAAMRLARAEVAAGAASRAWAGTSRTSRTRRGTSSSTRPTSRPWAACPTSRWTKYF